MPKAIPERAPVEDRFHGVVLRVGDATALALEADPAATVVASGDLIVRYGARLFGKVHLSIVPALVVLDYGEMLTGEAAWDFVYKRSNLHPRAEVAGYRSDGVDDMIFIRQLDLAVPADVLVYDDGAAVVPVARPTACIAPDAALLPPRVTELLPRYPSVATWVTEEQP